MMPDHRALGHRRFIEGSAPVTVRKAPPSTPGCTARLEEGPGVAAASVDRSGWRVGVQRHLLCSHLLQLRFLVSGDGEAPFHHGEGVGPRPYEGA